ncbi:hypothetical protein GALL_352980 [mine drainage metagenome]|uniref:Uncharacterized protein n=1 Tax=mine drainage metagenome TaxID=410659 RepID=A0A1J5QHD5_9ZZZZ
MGFAEGRLVLAERAIHFVGGHVQEAEVGFRFAFQCIPVGAHGLQQVESADDVGLNEVARTMDGAVDMRLGGEVDDGARSVFGKQPGYQGGIGYIATHEHMPHVVAQTDEIFQVTRIGQLVEVDDRLTALPQPVQDKIASDESCTACD